MRKHECLIKVMQKVVSFAASIRYVMIIHGVLHKLKNVLYLGYCTYCREVNQESNLITQSR